MPAPAPSPPLPGRSSYTLPDEETLPEPFTKEASPPPNRAEEALPEPLLAGAGAPRPSTAPRVPPRTATTPGTISESDDGDIAEAPQPAPSSDDEAGVHIPTLGEASPARPGAPRRTLADSHDRVRRRHPRDRHRPTPTRAAAPVLVAARAPFVVEGDDGDSFRGERLIPRVPAVRAPTSFYGGSRSAGRYRMYLTSIPRR